MLVPNWIHAFSALPSSDILICGLREFMALFNEGQDVQNHNIIMS